MSQCLISAPTAPVVPFGTSSTTFLPFSIWYLSNSPPNLDLFLFSQSAVPPCSLSLSLSLLEQTVNRHRREDQQRQGRSTCPGTASFLPCSPCCMLRSFLHLLKHYFYPWALLIHLKGIREPKYMFPSVSGKIPTLHQRILYHLPTERRDVVLVPLLIRFYPTVVHYDWSVYLPPEGGFGRP